MEAGVLLNVEVDCLVSIISLSTQISYEEEDPSATPYVIIPETR